MVSSGTVHMPMCEFLGCGMSYLDYFNIENQCLARQRMIGIDIGCVSACLRHRDCTHPVAGAKLYYSARA